MGYHDQSRENEVTLFLTLRLSNLLLSLSFSTRKHVSMASLLSFFLISLKKNEFKTTHNTFQDCRVHFFEQPLYLFRAVKLYMVTQTDFVGILWSLARAFCRNNKNNNIRLRCFDAVCQRPYQYFSIALKVVFSLSDRQKLFTSNWLWIEICENVVLSKNRFYYDNNKQKIDKGRILCDLDQLLKIQH